MKKEKILVAMSGGVDSSVAAALLVRAGYECVGVTMHLFGPDTLCTDSGYETPDQHEGAREVAEVLGIEFHVVDLSEDFHKNVVSPFIKQYAAGRTPNPCVVCNRELKFQALWEKGRQLGCDAMATGHYVISKQHQGRPALFKGHDLTRDQSYFLFLLNAAQLQRARFPLGEMKKTEVRALAAELNLPAAEKPESREICFVPDDDYVSYIEKAVPGIARAGNIVDRDGKVLGQHQGIHRYTTGQRKGLGIAFSEPLYVIEIRPEQNEVVVGIKKDVFDTEIFVRNCNWISGEPPQPGTEALVKVRYKHSGVMATIFPLADNAGRIVLSQPVSAITPGQAAVAYDGDRVLGGGWIERSGK